MKKIKNNTIILISIILLCCFLYGIYLVGCKIWFIIKAANPTVIVAFIGGGVTITASIISVFFGRYLERKKSIENEIRNKKLPIYENFIKEILSWLLKKGDKSPDEITGLLQDFSHKIILWGNQDVIKKWVDFRLHSMGNGDNDKHIMVVFEEFLFEIRKDIGQDNSKLSNGDLMSIFINNYVAHMKKLESENSKK